MSAGRQGSLPRRQDAEGNEGNYECHGRPGNGGTAANRATAAGGAHSADAAATGATDVHAGAAARHGDASARATDSRADAGPAVTHPDDSRPDTRSTDRNTPA